MYKILRTLDIEWADGEWLSWEQLKAHDALWIDTTSDEVFERCEHGQDADCCRECEYAWWRYQDQKYLDMAREEVDQ